MWYDKSMIATVRCHGACCWRQPAHSHSTTGGVHRAGLVFLSNFIREPAWSILP